jgi:hypothetical protein
VAAKKIEPPPWSFPLAELNSKAINSDIAAIRATADGTADEYQQRAAFAFICRRLCGEGQMTFWPGGEDGRRATDFAEGRRWVGIQLRRIVALVPERIDTRGEPPQMPAAQASE